MSAQVLYCMSVPPSGSSDKHMEDYLNTLFDRCEHGFIEIRRKVTPDLTKREWITLSDQNLPSFPDDENIFIGVATRKNKYDGGGRNNLFQIPAVWLDIDFKDTEEVKARELIKKFSLKPSMIVNSGNGLHLYWLLENPAQPEDIQKIEEVNKNLARHFEGDSQTTDAAHVMRLPGTYNQKYTSKLVTIESHDANKAYRIEDFNFLPLPSPPTQPQSAAPDKNSESYVDLLYGVEKGKRHDALIRLAGLCKRTGASIDETKNLLFHWNRNNSEQETEKELIYQIEDLYNRYPQKEEPSDTALDKCQLIEDSALSIPDLISLDLNPEPFIIEPWLRRGELVMISAERGIGKTWLALSIGMAATRTMTIGKWKTGNCTGCLYIDGEMPPYLLKFRILSLVNVLPSQQAPFKILSAIQMRSMRQPSPKLTDEAWRKGILDYLRKNEIFKLLILDNIASLSTGIDENTKRDWDEINQWFLNLRALGVTMIMVHHENKKGEQRGTGSREDNIDYSIKLTKLKDNDGKENTKFKVKFTKTRGIPQRDAKTFNLILKEVEQGFIWEEEGMVEDDSQSVNPSTAEKAIRLLKQGIPQNEVAGILEVSSARVNAIANEAIKAGKLADYDVVKGKPGRKSKKEVKNIGDTEEQIKDSPLVEEVRELSHEDKNEDSPEAEEVEVGDIEIIEVIE